MYSSGSAPESVVILFSIDTRAERHQMIEAAIADVAEHLIPHTGILSIEQEDHRFGNWVQTADCPVHCYVPLICMAPAQGSQVQRLQRSISPFVAVNFTWVVLKMCDSLVQC